MLEAAPSRAARGRRRRGRRGRDPRPRRDRGAARGPRDPARAHDRVPRHRRSRSSTSTRALARRPRLILRRRAGAHQRARLPPRQALAGRRGAARRRHRRLHHAQRPAPREPERRRRADHRRRGARDGAGLRSSTQADEVELVDLPPDELLQRLREGKVYMPEQAARGDRAILPQGQSHRAARAGAAPHGGARRRPDASATGATQAIARDLAGGRAHPGRASGRARRRRGWSAPRARMAAGSSADWVVGLRRDAGARAAARGSRPRSRRRICGSPRSWARETSTLTGAAVRDELLAYARAHNVTKILVGKPRTAALAGPLSARWSTALVRGSGDIDVYVITRRTGARHRAAPRAGRSRPSHGAATSWARSCVAVCTARRRCWSRRVLLELANLVMIYLLGVVVGGRLRAGARPSSRPSSASPPSISSSSRPRSRSPSRIPITS